MQHTKSMRSVYKLICQNIQGRKRQQKNIECPSDLHIKICMGVCVFAGTFLEDYMRG